MAQLLKNNVSGTLATQLNAENTSMVLVDASNFPSPAGSDFYLLTLVGLNTNGQEATWEVVKVIAKASNTMTVVRAQEGTTAATWPVGTTVQLRLTADSVVTPTALDASIAAHVAALDPHPTYTTASEAAAAAPVQSVAGRTGAVTLAKADVGLGSVDNTTDTAKPVSTAQQTALNEKVAKAGDTMTGNLDFSGTALRIRGDFSNATQASRLAFQTSTVNGNTSLTAIPNGTAAGAAYNVFNRSDPNNASYGQLLAGEADMRLLSAAVGSGTQLPLQFYIGPSKVVDIGTNRRVALTPNNENFALQLNNGATTNGPFLGSAGTDIFVVSTSGGTEVLRTDASRNVLVTGGGGLGYGVGSGGTVTQATNKSTAVTLNKPSGKITMHNEALAPGAQTAYTLTNSFVSAADTVVATIVNSSCSAGAYALWVSAGPGFFNVYLKNISAGSLSESLALNYTVIKGATS